MYTDNIKFVIEGSGEIKEVILVKLMHELRFSEKVS